MDLAGREVRWKVVLGSEGPIEGEIYKAEEAKTYMVRER